VTLDAARTKQVSTPSAGHQWEIPASPRRRRRRGRSRRGPPVACSEGEGELDASCAGADDADHAARFWPASRSASVCQCSISPRSALRQWHVRPLPERRGDRASSRYRARGVVGHVGGRGRGRDGLRDRGRWPHRDRVGRRRSGRAARHRYGCRRSRNGSDEAWHHAGIGRIDLARDHGQATPGNGRMPKRRSTAICA